ncbi:hypothetical protein Lbys_1053 [Leadbetterella byssophila DSM 17132]|uniref:Uncharacterized protein n=1 Tax=Leadbetterella byssophila (strain DSM 17132 / JCM 16389 / KACC 11308 / NBRC 106382 / 4M15) TaxID=649349 RepID=E4RSU0_LEAB4|nr:hypothetical protein [Leadbetterella byssophila]ADQ16779.1 hypothetical protein Lbys_1053 [Leadbetterella byssophila DSM 17132]
MKTVKIYTYNPKNQKSGFEFYALSKGLNSGKPLDVPCPNCFVISCRNAEELDVYRSLLFGLWKTKAFYPFLIGSVIPYIRIGDFKKFVSEQASHLKGREKVFRNDIRKVKTLEQREKHIHEQLLLISELKHIYIARHLKQ